MDNRPIGFFDSGLGGLTTIPYLMEALPDEKIIYFGDTARTPYGSKAVHTIRQFSLEIADFLVSQGVKMIVIACNTVTSTCLELLKQKYPKIPIIGIIAPAAKKIAKTCSRDNRIGIIGTKATIQNDAYSRIIHINAPHLKLYSKACPIFVPMIEEGLAEDDMIILAIKHYLNDFIQNNQLDTLVLGCTHYPLIRNQIHTLYPNLHIIDPSQEIIADIKKELMLKNMLAEQSSFENTFYASDLSENFLNMINIILQNAKYHVAFKSFDL